jgi:ferredoxin
MKLKLAYTRFNVTKPVLSQAILKTGVAINILEAKIGASYGEMVVDANADGRDLAKLISFLEAEGLTIVQLGEALEIDLRKCISCGACVSPCPTGAIMQLPSWEIEFDDTKCIRCGTCVGACPVRAIRLTT